MQPQGNVFEQSTGTLQAYSSQAVCLQLMKCIAIKYHDRKHEKIKHEGAS